MFKKNQKNKVKAKLYQLVTTETKKYYDYQDNPIANEEPSREIVTAYKSTEYWIITENNDEIRVNAESGNIKKLAKEISDHYGIELENL